MKNFSSPFLLTSVLLVMLSLVGCTGCADQNKYETRYSADGKDSVVYVHYRDNTGQNHDFFMNYLMFRALFNNGGYSACHNYYNSHPAPRVNNYHTYVTRTERPSSYNSYNSYSRSAGSNSTSSGSSGSSSKSYSSPSRSYTSPSRSYSSPSRSYSSPSRH